MTERRRVSVGFTIVCVSDKIKTANNLVTGSNTTTEYRVCIVDTRVNAGDLFELCCTWTIGQTYIPTLMPFPRIPWACNLSTPWQTQIRIMEYSWYEDPLTVSICVDSESGGILGSFVPLTTCAKTGLKLGWKEVKISNPETSIVY